MHSIKLTWHNWLNEILVKDRQSHQLSSLYLSTVISMQHKWLVFSFIIPQKNYSMAATILTLFHFLTNQLLQVQSVSPLDYKGSKRKHFLWPFLYINLQGCTSFICTVSVTMILSVALFLIFSLKKLPLLIKLKIMAPGHTFHSWSVKRVICKRTPLLWRMNVKLPKIKYVVQNQTFKHFLLATQHSLVTDQSVFKAENILRCSNP